MNSHANGIHRKGMAEILPVTYDVRKGAGLFYGERETQFLQVRLQCWHEEEKQAVVSQSCGKSKGGDCELI